MAKNGIIQWFMDNWIGGLIGAIIPYIWLISKFVSKTPTGETYYYCSVIVDSIPCSLTGFITFPSHLFIAVIGFLIGAFIQSKFKR